MALAWLIPVTLALGGAGLAAYVWSVRAGQYEDLSAAAWRILEEEDASPGLAAREGASRGRAGEGEAR